MPEFMGRGQEIVDRPRRGDIEEGHLVGRQIGHIRAGHLARRFRDIVEPVSHHVIISGCDLAAEAVGGVLQQLHDLVHLHVLAIAAVNSGIVQRRHLLGDI